MAEFLADAAADTGRPPAAFFPVWQRMSLQLALLTALGSLIVVAFALFELPLDSRLERFAALGMTLVPLLLWASISVYPEFQFYRPRRRLVGVAVVSALTASALGLPLIEDFFRVQEWLPLESVSQRILGYSLTVGVLDTGLKFLVLRYLIYPQALRVRSDAIAYAFAAALGYSFYLSLALVARQQPTLGFAALVVLGNLGVQLFSALFIALGIIESYFSDAFPLVLPLNLVAATAGSGLITALSPGLLSGPLSAAGSGDRPLFALGIVVATFAITLGMVYFLYSNSERREREAYLGSGAADGI